MPLSPTRVTRRFFRSSQIAMLAIGLAAGSPAFATLVFNINFDDAGMQSVAGGSLSSAEVANVHAAFNAAAAQISGAFNDPIHVNITVTSVAGTGTLGQSSTFLNTFSFAALRAALLGDSKSADDATSVGAGGSVPSSDPVLSTHKWWVSTAEAKALGLIADNLTTDGTFTFGAGFNYDFDPSNGIGAGQFDFQGVALHEITEIMGRIPGLGTTISGQPAYMAYDLFRYLSAGSRGLTNGAGINFSINNGSTLLKPYNNASVNGGDPQDWGSGANDAFNAFSSSDVVNGLSAVDFRVMDVIGFDSTVPEPATGVLALSALLAGGLLRRRAISRRPRA